MVEEKVDKPWGYYYNIEEADTYLIKKIVVHPNNRLSLQSHEHRSENWTVLRGKAKVTINGEKKILSVGDHVYVDKGSKHRLSNPYSEVLEVLEIQTGEILSEDDIIRYEDDYDRG